MCTRYASHDYQCFTYFGCPYLLASHYVINTMKPFMMDDMLLYRASHFFEHWISCANRYTHVHIMMDDVYIYHAHTLFLLSQCSVGPHIHSSTSRFHELTKRDLERNESMG